MALSSDTLGAKPRLANGQLRALVLQHLHAHPDDFTTTRIARALNRSADAITNACHKPTVPSSRPATDPVDTTPLREVARCRRPDGREHLNVAAAVRAARARSDRREGIALT
ncbi:MAG: hypothetical protein ACRC35_07080 [Angustibacter sp.]